MKVKIIRSSLVYGKGMKGNLGLLKKYAQRKYLPQIPEFNNRKSMVHVDDVARSLLYLANNVSISNDIFYLTDGNSYSTRQIFEKLRFGESAKENKLALPLFLFKALSLFNSKIKKRFDKLSSSELYSSEKLKKIGFDTKFSLENIDEEII